MAIDLGDHFDMRDYYVLSMDRVGGKVVDHGVALDVADFPWAERQMWSNDAAHRNGTYYMYFGGIWGGQLQRWRTGRYDPDAPQEPNDDGPAIGPRVAGLRDDMLDFAEAPREITILDEHGEPIRATDHERRFVEACWMHRYQGRYYLSYSTGNTHLLVYATGDNPYGPFTYPGVVLTPVLGWTTHHSIVEFQGKWYLFYHDSSLSGGQTHLRSVKVAELVYRPDGPIVTLDGSR